MAVALERSVSAIDLDMKDIFADIIPPSDYEHRNGFDNIPSVERLSLGERKSLEGMLLERLKGFPPEQVDTLVIDTLAFLRSEAAIPILREMLLEQLSPSVKLVIVTAIYRIEGDKEMVPIAIDLVRKIDSEPGPYRISDLTNAFYYLARFNVKESSDLLITFAEDKEYLIAYNAKRYLETT